MKRGLNISIFVILLLLASFLVFSSEIFEEQQIIDSPLKVDSRINVKYIEDDLNIDTVIDIKYGKVDLSATARDGKKIAISDKSKDDLKDKIKVDLVTSSITPTKETKTYYIGGGTDVIEIVNQTYASYESDGWQLNATLKKCSSYATNCLSYPNEIQLKNLSDGVGFNWEDLTAGINDRNNYSFEFESNLDLVQIDTYIWRVLVQNGESYLDLFNISGLDESEWNVQYDYNINTKMLKVYFVSNNKGDP